MKEHKHSTCRIDLAVAAVMAHDVAATWTTSRSYGCSMTERGETLGVGGENAEGPSRPREREEPPRRPIAYLQRYAAQAT
jgi:hypothetical protein